MPIVLRLGVAIASAWALSPASWAACSKPVVPSYDAAAYYAPAAGLGGAALKSALHDIIDGHIVQTYTCAWDVLKEADQDPANPNNVIDVYSRRSIPKADQDTGGNTPNAWNREHVWANSHGFPDSGYHAYTDTHHLYAADKSINADRGNDDFAYGGQPNPECPACKEDNGLETWEAPDLVKGDIARAMFYMATRYAGSGDGGTPDLELVDRLTNTGERYFGDLCDLVAWHLADPVSVAEQQRNDVIYSWQGNRNPFADHPEYVVSIWGPSCGIAAPAAQTLSFPPLADVPAGSIVMLAASASSGLPVSFTSQTPDICAVVGNQASTLAAGACAIAANQAGDADYAAAPQVVRSFTVQALAQSIDFAAPADRALDSGSFALTASASSGLPVSYASLTASVCGVVGNSVDLLAAGTCSIAASQAGNASYAAAATVTHSFAVSAGAANGEDGDVPLPAWALFLLAAGLFGAMRRMVA